MKKIRKEKERVCQCVLRFTFIDVLVVLTVRINAIIYYSVRHRKKKKKKKKKEEEEKN